MNFKKIIASVAACALAVSAMAVNTFALTTSTHMTDDKGTLYVISEKPEEEKPSWITYSGYTIEDVYGVTFHVEFKAEEVADPASWIGGGIGANSNSTGWKSIEWGRNDKEITADLENGTITWLSDTPVFKADDKYAQFWLQTWGGTVTIVSVDVLGKDGAVLSDDVSDADAEAAFNAANSEDADAAADDAAADDADADTDDGAEAVGEDTDADDTDVVDDAADDTDAVDDTDADVADDSADNDVADAPAADTSTPAAATGNTAAASIAVVMAVAGAAAVAAKKRK